MFDHEHDHDSQWAATRSVATKIGCLLETLRQGVRQAERDTGRRPELTTEEQRYCQELWISDPRDQAASFRSPSVFRSFCTPSTKTTPALTSGRRWARLRRRHRRCAMSSSLYAISRPFVREPAPLVTRCRNRTVANGDSITFVVRRCVQCSVTVLGLAPRVSDRNAVMSAPSDRHHWGRTLGATKMVPPPMPTKRDILGELTSHERCGQPRLFRA